LRIAKGTQLADHEIRCASCNAINRIGSYRIDRIPWCGKCRAALPEATSRRAIRRLYQYRRYYWIAAVLGMVSIVIWQASAVVVKASVYYSIGMPGTDYMLELADPTGLP
jgi:hypothetical protein